MMQCMLLTPLIAQHGFQRGIDSSMEGSTVAEGNGSMDSPEMVGTLYQWSWVLRQQEIGLKPGSASCVER